MCAWPIHDSNTDICNAREIFTYDSYIYIDLLKDSLTFNTTCSVFIIVSRIIMISRLYIQCYVQFVRRMYNVRLRKYSMTKTAAWPSSFPCT